MRRSCLGANRIGLQPTGSAGSLPTMRQLLLLRHAKSSWDDPALSDHARPLNRRGRQAAHAMREATRKLGLAPDLVLVSSARRTLQTLEALEPWDDPAPIVEPLDALYLAEPAQILGVLHEVKETVRSVLLLGHNPGLHELAVMLAGAHAMLEEGPARRLAESYPSGALCEFAIAGPWRALEEGGTRLVRFLCPKDLPEYAA